MKTNLLRMLLFFSISITTQSFSASLNDVYVQRGGKLIGFSDAVLGANGSIVSTGQPSKYLIRVNKRKAVIDFSSRKSILEKMSVLYPDDIVIQITFSKVKPNTVAYIDNSVISNIDKNGDSITPKFPVSKPGRHRIELRKYVTKLDSFVLNIDASSYVICSGKFKMKCNIESA